MEDFRRSVDQKFRDVGEVLNDIRSSSAASFHELQNKLSSSQRTNWGTVMAAMLVGIALWAAAIRPIDISLDNERSETRAGVDRIHNDAADLAKAVLEQNKQISSLQNAETKAEADRASLRADIIRMDMNGTAGTSLRLGEVLATTKSMKEDLDQIRDKGSPITDKRLALLEQRLEGKAKP